MAISLDAAKSLLDGGIREAQNLIKDPHKVDEWVTDNYNWISLVWEDGSESYISLNLRNLEYPVHSNIHVYALENLGKFWSYAENYLKEDE